MQLFKPNLWKIIITVPLGIPIYYFFGIIYSFYIFDACVPLVGGGLPIIPGEPAPIRVPPPPPCGFLTKLLQMPAMQIVIEVVIVLLTLLIAYVLASLVVKLYGMYMKQRAVLEKQEVQKKLQKGPEEQEQTHN